MALIDEATRTRLRERLAGSLREDVELRLYRKPDSGRLILQGVPRTVVNRAGAFVGALPEAQFVDSVLQLAGVEPA